MNKEPDPQFERIELIAKSEKLTHLKHELLEGGGVESIAEQPHGIDFSAADLIAFDKNNLESAKKIEWQKLTNAEGDLYAVTTLEANKEYFILLDHLLKKSLGRMDYTMAMFPRSSLLRAGIIGERSPFSGTYIGKEGKMLKELSPEYDFGRQGAFRIKVVNPNGVEIEKNTPVVQAVFTHSPRKMREKFPKDKFSQEQEDFEKEHKVSKFETLHLGQVSRFTERTPHLSSERARQDLNVTEPCEASGGTYVLRAGAPYLLRTAETITLANHEVATTHGFLKQTELSVKEIGYGAALVDAGYSGQLTYLVMPKEDITLTLGEKIADLSRTNVPATKKTYKGQWK